MDRGWIHSQEATFLHYDFDSIVVSQGQLLPYPMIGWAVPRNFGGSPEEFDSYNGINMGALQSYEKTCKSSNNFLIFSMP